MQHHYTYSITYTDVPNIYYGVRTSKYPPEEDIKYWGTPTTFRAFMEDHKATRVKTILAIYDSREEAELAEDEWILQQWGVDKSLSLNATIRGANFNTLGTHLSVETRKKISKANKGIPNMFLAKSFVGVSPSGEHVFFTNSLQFCRDNPSWDFDQTKITSCARGRRSHHRGWRFFYLKDYEAMNGIVPNVELKFLPRTYVGVSPQGDQYIFTNAAKFCRDNPNWKFNISKITACAKGTRKTHKSWRFSYNDEFQASVA